MEEFVPGTIYLVDMNHRHGHEGGPTLGKDGIGIELHPKPSNNPEDPLNWSKQRKINSLIATNVYTFAVALVTALQYPLFASMTEDVGISTSDLVQGCGVMFLLLGFGCLFWQPVAMTYGRRGVYLVSLLGTIPCMVWTGYTNSTASWYGHRALIGFFVAPAEALPEVSIPDVFFAHERGRWISLYVFNVFGSNFLAPIISGWLAEAIGWRWVYWAGAILTAVGFVYCYFFLEETMYLRNTIEGEEDVSDHSDIKDSVARVASKQSQSKTDAEDVTTQINNGALASPSYPQARTYRQKLSFWVKLEGRFTKTQMLQQMYLPIVFIVQFPTVFWAGFIYGINLVWYNVMNGTASPIMSAPPYNWSSGLVGTVYVGPLIGSALSSYFAGRLADMWTLRLARRNHGIREPEQRLWGIAVSGILASAGLILWGVGAARHIHWFGLVFGLGMVSTGVVVAGVIGLSYNVDCFKDISGGTTASVIIVRNTMSFALSYGITPWWENMGLQNCFITVCMVCLVTNATFLLLVWKGKSLRRAGAKTYLKYASMGLLGRH